MDMMKMRSLVRTQENCLLWSVRHTVCVSCLLVRNETHSELQDGSRVLDAPSLGLNGNDSILILFSFVFFFFLLEKQPLLLHQFCCFLRYLSVLFQMMTSLKFPHLQKSLVTLQDPHLRKSLAALQGLHRLLQLEELCHLRLRQQSSPLRTAACQLKKLTGSVQSQVWRLQKFLQMMSKKMKTGNRRLSWAEQIWATSFTNLQVGIIGTILVLLNSKGS